MKHVCKRCCQYFLDPTILHEDADQFYKSAFVQEKKPCQSRAFYLVWLNRVRFYNMPLFIWSFQFLPYVYSVKLEGQEKVVSGIPPDDLVWVHFGWDVYLQIHNRQYKVWYFDRTIWTKKNKTIRYTATGLFAHNSIQAVQFELMTSEWIVEYLFIVVYLLGWYI